MKATAPKQPPREAVSSAKAQQMLKKINWTNYWRNVTKDVADEVDRYEAARAKSLRSVAHLVFR